MEHRRTANNGTPKPTSIVCAGLNAHSQLQAGTTTDIRKFAPLKDFRPSQEGADVLFAGWSITVFSSGNKIWTQGFQPISSTLSGNAAQEDIHVPSVIGDHDGLLALLSTSGDLYTVFSSSDAQPSTLQLITTESSPSIALVALSGTGRTALTFKQAPNGNLCHIAVFNTLDRFLAWYRDPSDSDCYPDKHHMLPGRPAQLLANTASFILLLENGEVYSWGDPRHQSLGRAINGEGGWMSAAISEDGALYLWGAAAAPGHDRSIRCLREAGAGEVALVELLASAHDEPLDVIDVAIGDAHVAVATTNGRLFVVGDNKDGQLGLDSTEDFIEDWTEVRSPSSVQRVVCGPRSTYVFVHA
ncbi:hypothetical protein LTR56_021398 [Elasticomyces elasticus]|nr:hypothetical protein LTR22_026459 [Elasticomyces elasticus]KAK3623745.1 hypothetical protein LTR56_021398 [Elasticomyces elasticus]KAK4898115.1 hypothetical protein LTR49_027863 [Elasticomyces elasticus]KAK5754310.1 hypothetical protein LTS12_015601 [Elasticomyces elasticus]